MTSSSEDAVSILDQVRDELERFVDLPGGVTGNNMALAVRVTALLGDGDPEQALFSLQGIRRRASSRFVSAAFAHLGGDGSRGNTEQRLADFAEQWAVDEGVASPTTRTVRRWSDRGLEILAREIVEVSGLEPPTLHLDVLPSPEGGALLLPTLHQLHGYQMNDPLAICVAPEEHSVHVFEAEEVIELGASVRQAADVVHFPMALPLHIQVLWLGETRPTFVVRLINWPQDVVAMVTQSAGGSGVLLYREGDDIDTLADIAFELLAELPSRMVEPDVT